MDLASECGAPIIGLNDSGGARIQEGVRSLGGYARHFLTQHHGIWCGAPNFGYFGALCRRCRLPHRRITDFVFMVEEKSYMFVTGPEVVETVTHEKVTKEELGGASTHSEKSGVAHFACATEQENISFDSATTQLPTFEQYANAAASALR